MLTGEEGIYGVTGWRKKWVIPMLILSIVLTYVEMS
jgi:hypothetical protein